jgi:hypothetical protein
MKSNSEVKRVLTDIRSLKEQNKNDKEIRDILGLKVRMYQRYVKRVHELDQEIWRKITYTQLESELLKLKQSFEDTYIITKRISESDDKPTQEILEALNAKDNARLNIVRLLVDGPPLVAESENSRMNQSKLHV